MSKTIHVLMEGDKYDTYGVVHAFTKPEDVLLYFREENKERGDKRESTWKKRWDKSWEGGHYWTDGVYRRWIQLTELEE